jgi:hypothetical protein
MDIEKILLQMSLEDKVALCTGKNFWQTRSFEKYGIPSLFMCDGPLGLRKQEKASDMLDITRDLREKDTHVLKTPKDLKQYPEAVRIMEFSGCDPKVGKKK